MRPDYITKMQQAGIKAIKANKSVMEGIATVASLFKQNKLFVVKENVKLFDHEIYNYVWKPNSDEPIKADDDFLDSLRYCIFTYVALMRIDEDSSRDRDRRRR